MNVSMTGRSGARAALLAVLLGGSWGCGGPPAASTINVDASLAGSLPYNPLGWMVIASFVDHPAGTMSTLYGNDAAVQYARSHAAGDYPPGSVVSLVTWQQQDDVHWFGGRIPGRVKSVEFVSVASGAGNHSSYSYECYEGSPLVRTTTSSGGMTGGRAAFLLAQRAAVMP